MTKVTVVVPVYNVETYLPACLDSIIAQTLDEIEIICIDDGSTDSSPMILQKYALEDDRILVIHQENHGAGFARNVGMQRATGEYIIFLDSDDYFSAEMLETMYCRAKTCEADLCMCDAQDINDLTGEKLYHSYLRKPYPDHEPFNCHDCPDRIYNISAIAVWNKLLRRKFIEEYNISFPECSRYEDVSFAFKVYSFAEKIVTVPRKLICYRRNRPGSLLTTCMEEPACVAEAYSFTYKELEKAGVFKTESLRRSFLDKAANIYYYHLDLLGNYDNYRKCYESIFGPNSLLEQYEPCGNELKNIQMYLEHRTDTPEEFLYFKHIDTLNKYEALRDKYEREKRKVAKNRKLLDTLKKENEELREELTRVSREKCKLKRLIGKE